MATGHTRQTLAALVATLIPDASIASTDIISWIEAAHTMFPGQMFVDYSDETSITVAEATYEYALPETMNVSTFVAIQKIQLETEIAGYFGGQLPYPNIWQVDFDGAGVWTLKLAKDYPLTTGRKLRITGQRKFVVPTADGSVIELDAGWLLNYVLFLGHSSRGGSSSDLAAWHQRMAGVYYQGARDIESRMVNRIHPGSVLVPGVY